MSEEIKIVEIFENIYDKAIKYSGNFDTIEEYNKTRDDANIIRSFLAEPEYKAIAEEVELIIRACKGKISQGLNGFYDNRLKYLPEREAIDVLKYLDEALTKCNAMKGE